LFACAVNSDPPDREPEFESAPVEDDLSVSKILISPDGTHLVCYGSNKVTKEGVVLFWDLESRKLVNRLTQPTGVLSAAFTPDGKRLITAGEEAPRHEDSSNKIRIFVGPNWILEHAFENDPPTHSAKGLVVFPDGGKFLSTTNGRGVLRIWDLNQRRASSLPVNKKQQIIELAVFQDSKRIAVTYGNSTEIWDVEKRAILGQVSSGGSHVAVSPDGKRFATAGVPGQITIWDANSFAPHKELSGTTYYPEAIAFTKDSKFLIGLMGADSEDPIKVPAKISIWDVRNGNLLFSFNARKGSAERMALSPDNRWLVTLSAAGGARFRIWDFNKIRREFEK
jgi:WD40 repeat protein